MLTNLTATNPAELTGLAAVCACLIWLLKQTVVALINIIRGKTSPVETISGQLNAQFSHYTEVITRHDQRLLQLEKIFESLLKERCCPVHDETMSAIHEIKDKLSCLASIKPDVQGIKERLDALHDMGAFHSHNK